jgi:hypothetical protein
MHFFVLKFIPDSTLVVHKSSSTGRRLHELYRLGTCLVPITGGKEALLAPGAQNQPLSKPGKQTTLHPRLKKKKKKRTEERVCGLEYLYPLTHRNPPG